MKSSFPKPRGKGGQLLVEPSEYGLGLSSRIVWSMSSRRSVRICTIFTIARRPVGLREVDLIEVINVVVLGVVGEKMVQGVSIDQICTHQPKIIVPRHVLYWGREWSALNDTPVRSCRDHQIYILPPRTMCMSRVLSISGMVTLECKNFIVHSRLI